MIAAALTPFQIFVGDTAARAIASRAAGQVRRDGVRRAYLARSPEYLGGVYVNGHVYFGLAIPDMDSLLVGFSPHTQVTGWDTVAPADRPPAPTLIHLSFDAMVGLAFLLLVAGTVGAVDGGGGARTARQRWFWWLAAACGPAALVAMECGWIVTEVGRQPWVVYKLHDDGAGGDDQPRRDREPDGRDRRSTPCSESRRC